MQISINYYLSKSKKIKLQNSLAYSEKSKYEANIPGLTIAYDGMRVRI